MDFNFHRVFMLFSAYLLALPILAQDTLLTSQQLTLNQYLESPNGAYRLYLQGDGNIVLRDWNTKQALWSAGTHGQNGVKLRLQGDGNLVLRNKRSKPLWSTKTHGKGVIKAVMRNDGNFVLYNSSNQSVWSTGTRDATPPTISLIGASTIEIEMGASYQEFGANATDNADGNLDDAIVITGNVNTSAIGSYIVRYNVTDSAGNNAAEVTRTVNVIAPAQENLGDTLTRNQQLNINQRLESNNGKYKVTMQSDGNLVLRNTETSAALWSSKTHNQNATRARLQGDGNFVIRNSNGNALWSTQTHNQGVTRLVMQNDGNLVLYTNDNRPVWSTDTAEQPQDTIKPEITLVGDANITIEQGTSYQDAGATAYDNVDGDITGLIQVTGFVDTSILGVYTLTYQVSDAAGNQADSVTRTIEVITEPDDNPTEPPVDSRGIFSSPSAALYAHNDTRQAAFPAIIDTGFSGNGHSETWDGRIFVRKRSQGWFASTFRPERITKNNAGVVNFRNGAFGNSVMLEARDAQLDIHQNWLAIVPDFAVTGENPYPSDANGNFNKSGSFATYKTIIYQTSTRNGDNDQMGFRLATFIVRDAYTPNAEVASADFTNDFQKLTLVNGNDFRCIEPSATMDGRLIICQGHPDNNGRIDNLVYSWNSDPGAISNWSIPKSIANMYWDDRNQMVDGIKFSVRFPIAEQPLHDAAGATYARNTLVKGAYPWVSHDGSELFYQASREGVSARRTATTVVGRWTGWILRHIDGPINPNRHRDTRLFISSPGAFTTMWTPYQHVDDLKIPYSTRGPSYPIFGSNNHDYSEVSFNDYLDGNFILYYGMNEQIARSGSFLKTQTPDTSGHFNNGQLVNAKFPIEFNNQDVLVGQYGQAIYFEQNSYIDVTKNSGWEQLGEQVTVDFWVKKLSGSGDIPLFNLEGGIEIYLQSGNTPTAVFTDTESSTAVLSGQPISNDQWVHVAFTFDEPMQQVAIYQNGQLLMKKSLAPFGVLSTAGNVKIGPRSANALLLMDEVKVSKVARSADEIAFYANTAKAEPASSELQELIPHYLLNQRFNATSVDRFSLGAAMLGEQLFNDEILSLNQTTSCATCHEPERSFTDGKAIAQGNEPTDAGVRNTPTIQNRLFSSKQGWSGAANSLDSQALIPIQAVHEMNLTIEAAAERLSNTIEYVELFNQVYGEAPNADNISAALASFQAIQFSPENRVDQFILGDESALTDAERQGFNLFNNKARCAGCHSGSNFTDESFRNNGLVASADIGRAEITFRSRDADLFKVPTLRQVNQTAPYMHDGSIKTLREVIEAYNAGAPNDPNRDTDIRPLELSEQEISDLVAFLNALGN